MSRDIYYKYKSEYLQMRRMFGGTRIDISTITTSVRAYKYPSDDYGVIEDQLKSLYKVCEPDEEEFKPMVRDSIVVCLHHEDRVIGFLVITDTKILDDGSDTFTNKGGLRGVGGFFITSLCGDPRYRGISRPLFDWLYQHTRELGYSYLLLHASKARPHLRTFYEREDFRVNEEMTAKNTDFFIMSKTIA